MPQTGRPSRAKIHAARRTAIFDRDELRALADTLRPATAARDERARRLLRAASKLDDAAKAVAQAITWLNGAEALD
jgi:hypothetical protein